MPRGLALVIVLWVSVILAIIAANVTRVSRGNLALVRNHLERARAEQLADTGLWTAVLALSSNGEEEAWLVDGTVYAWRTDAGELRVEVTDESGKVNINSAKENFLTDFYAAAGLEHQAARELAAATADFRDGDSEPREGGAENPAYADAGKLFGAKNAPFQLKDELQHVMGFTRDLYRRLEPSVTLHSRNAVPDEEAATELVRAALNSQRLDLADGAMVPPADEASLSATPTIFLEGRSGRRAGKGVYQLHAEAFTKGGGYFAREAVARFSGRTRAPYTMLSWRVGLRRLFPEDAAPE